MKYVLTLAVLLTLVACKAEESSSSKNCTLNGQPIECKENKTTNAANDGSDSAGKGLALTVSVTADYRILDKHLEFLENTADHAVETRNGEEFECATGTMVGQTYEYKLNGNSLTFLDEEGNMTLSRISGDPKSIYGTWKAKENDEMGYTTTSLEISETEIKITNNCIFTK